ncbi:hypothetical protein BGZ76_002877, partial [Entomortierella beljakovae]
SIRLHEYSVALTHMEYSNLNVMILVVRSEIPDKISQSRERKSLRDYAQSHQFTKGQYLAMEGDCPESCN